MKFLNSEPKFALYDNKDSNSEFYYKGVFDRSITSIIATLDSGKFPDGLKGNFAFFYKSDRRVVMAVDHLPTINMFWREFDSVANHIFFSLRRKEEEPNDLIKCMRDSFWGGSVGVETTVKGIKRLEGGTYLEKDLESGITSVHRYLDLFTHEIDPSISKNDIAEITEQIIEEQTREPFNLLWSSGTDSNCILGFIRKLNRTDRCQLVSLYSDKTLTDERPQQQYLEEVYGLKALYINLGAYVGVSDDILNRLKDPNVSPIYSLNFKRTWNSFWWEPNIFQKYTALYENNLLHRPTLTGEAGDQIFGSRFGKTITSMLIQKPNVSTDEIAELFVLADAFRFIRSSYRMYDDWRSNLERTPFKMEAHLAAKEWVEKTWNKINCGGDIINQTELLQYLYKATHRCYNYSQLQGADFRHPFNDYRLFHTVFKTPGNWKVFNGKTRRLSLDIIKDFVDPGPWTWPKSGVNVPMQKRK